MCGIIAYIGDKPATPRLIEGLRRVVAEALVLDEAEDAQPLVEGQLRCAAVGREAEIVGEVFELT